MDLNSVGIIATIAGGSVIGGVTAGWRGLRKFFRFQDRLEETLAPGPDGKSISEQVAEIRKELHPNGGASLRDAVERSNTAASSAQVAAQQAADKAARSELIGNFDRADIRHKLTNIEDKMDGYNQVLSDHLVEAKVRTEDFHRRLEQIEQRSA